MVVTEGGEVRFGVLGPLRLERGGRAVRLPSGRQRSLLALLLLAGGSPLSRDRLIDELWGERPPASAVSALHVHLSKLRGLLGELLVLESSGYALRGDAYDLDVWRFDELVERARTDAPRARVLLAEALGLFHGEPLSDVACEGSLAQWRRSLEEKRLQATVARIDAELAAGTAAELVAELELLTREHPYEERVWGQLMLALYRSGRQADALAAYQRARRLFADELGLEPAEELVRLQQRILEHDPALVPDELEAESEPSSVRPRTRSNVPQAVTRFVGRDRELDALTKLLADRNVRMITLTGAGGVGKTRLLTELARAQEADHRDGAVFVRLERLTDSALVAAEIATTLSQRDGTHGPTADGLMRSLRERDLLMVLDNFEHLLPAAVLVAELLELAPGIRVLASSRSPLRIRGEHVFEVEPLALPVGESEAEVNESPAVQLFLQCALASNHKLEVDAVLARTVAGICRALDGLPLAIELAASRSQSLSPAQIADQLAEPLLVGQRALRDLPARQQSLQSTIRWSYELLGPDAQAVLRTAAVFVGGFTVQALEAVAGESVDEQLDELRDASLVRRQADETRLELLELVRAFARHELEASGEASEVRARHRHYFAGRLKATNEALERGGLPGELASPLLAAHANMRVALDDAIETGDVEAATALALGLRAVWFAGMLRQEAHEFVERLLARFQVSGPDELRLLRAAAFVEGSTPVAAALHERVASRAAEIGDWASVCTATCNLFGMALNTRNIEEIHRLRPALRDLMTPETSDKALGWVQLHLAVGAYVEDDLDQAIEHATRCVEHALRIDHDYLLATALPTRVLVSCAREGSISHGELSEALDRMGRTGVKTDAVIALWFVARYAATIDPASSGIWLAHAERILAELDSAIWPESILRDETMAVLGIDDLAPLVASTPWLDHPSAVADAAGWLSRRDPGESVPAKLRMTAGSVA